MAGHAGEGEFGGVLHCELDGEFGGEAAARVAPHGIAGDGAEFGGFAGAGSGDGGFLAGLVCVRVGEGEDGADGVEGGVAGLDVGAVGGEGAFEVRGDDEVAAGESPGDGAAGGGDG